MRHKFIAIGVLIVVASLTQMALADPMTNVVVNGTFQTTATVGPSGFVGLWAGSNELPGWTIGGSSIDVITTYWQAPPSGGNSVDLSGAGAGLTSQVLNTSPVPSLWTIDFYLTSNPDQVGDKTLLVTFGDYSWTFVVSPSGATRSDMNWEHIIISNILLDSSPTTLTFTSLTPGGFGPVIGGITVVDPELPNGSPVPEPASALLLGCGLVALTGLSRWTRFSI